MKTKSSQNQNGSTLVAVITTLATLMVIVGVAIGYTTTINRGVQRTNAYESAVAVADGCIEVMFANWRTTYRATPTQLLNTSAFSAIPTPAPSFFPNLPSANLIKRGTSFDPQNDEYDSTYTISNYKVVAVTAEYGTLASATTTPVPMFGQITSAVNSLSANSIKTTPLVLNYIASADVSLPGLGPNGNVVAKVRRVFSKQQLSPWNWAIFYVDPLEIHPGPLFTVTGWVHTNSDLYTAHSSLTFADKVTFGSDWFVAFKPGDAQHPSDVPAQPNYPSNLPPARDQAQQPFGLDSTLIFNTTNGNPNDDSYHELIDPPNISYSDPLAGQRYWDQASVIIRINADNSVIIGYPDSTNNYAFKSVNSSDWRYTMFNSAISTNQTIQDNRETANIRLATLDISKIETGAGANPSYKSANFNGIVYIYDASNSSSTRRGIRIKNGSKIPTSGLTLASQNPVYIQGDFNTGGTGSTVPSNNPSNLNADGTYINPTTPPSSQVSGYTRAPCSILADAVNILSNSWNDANAGTVPAASPTTVNVAVVAGIVPTSAVGGDGAYSGGAENFPRFLEDWTNQTLTYYGSMIELYKSAQSIGEWGKANVYAPPAREWFFDTNFKTTAPPGTLMVHSYVKGRWTVL